MVGFCLQSNSDYPELYYHPAQQERELKAAYGVLSHSDDRSIIEAGDTRRLPLSMANPTGR